MSVNEENTIERLCTLIASLGTVSGNDRWRLQNAVSGLRPATQADADRELRDEVAQWWDRMTNHVATEFVTSDPDWDDAVRRPGALSFVEEFYADEFRTYVAEQMEVSPEDVDIEPDGPEYVDEFLDQNRLKDEFWEWQHQQSEVVWGWMWATDSEMIADAAEAQGLIVVDGQNLDKDFGQYLIGSRSCGHSFLADYFVPMYLAIFPDRREFYTVEPGAKFQNL